MSLLSRPAPGRVRGPRAGMSRARRDVVRGPVAARVGVVLGLVAALAALPTLADERLLRGTDVMNGSARGTALVLLVLGVPTLLAGILLTERRAWVGPPLWLGALGLLGYNAVMFCFATPFNPAFPAYVAMLGLAVAGTVTLLRGLRPAVLLAEYRRPRRAGLVACYVWLVVALNAFAWLSVVVPAVLRDDPSFLDGSGLTTNPVFVQDLAFWLPLAALVGWWLWRGHDWGPLLTAGLLVFWVLESATVAVDQWLGSSADPASDVATAAGSVLFAGLTAVGVAVLALYLRGVAVARVRSRRG